MAEGKEDSSIGSVRLELEKVASRDSHRARPPMISVEVEVCVKCGANEATMRCVECAVSAYCTSCMDDLHKDNATAMHTVIQVGGPGDESGSEESGAGTPQWRDSKSLDPPPGLGSARNSNAGGAGSTGPSPGNSPQLRNTLAIDLDNLMPRSSTTEEWDANHSGWLEKKHSTGVGISSWQKRWWVVSLDDRALSYYKSQSQNLPLAFISLKDVLYCELSAHKNPRRFDIVLAKKVVALRAENAKSAQEWVVKINMCLDKIKEAEAEKKKKPQTPKTPLNLKASGSKDAAALLFTKGAPVSKLAKGFFDLHFAPETMANPDTQNRIFTVFPNETHILRTIIVVVVHRHVGDETEIDATQIGDSVTMNDLETSVPRPRAFSFDPSIEAESSSEETKKRNLELAYRLFLLKDLYVKEQGTFRDRLLQWVYKFDFFEHFEPADYAGKDLVMPLIWSVLQARNHFVEDNKSHRQTNNLAIPMQRLLSKAASHEQLDHDPSVEIVKFFQKRLEQGLAGSFSYLDYEVGNVFQERQPEEGSRHDSSEDIAVNKPEHWKDRYIAQCPGCQKSQFQFYQHIQKAFHSLHQETEVGVSCSNILVAMLVNSCRKFRHFGSVLNLHTDDFQVFNKPIHNGGIWRAFLALLSEAEPHVRRHALKDISGLLVPSYQNRISLLFLPGWQRHLFALVKDIEGNPAVDRGTEKLFQYVMFIFATLHFHLFSNQSINNVDFPSCLFSNLGSALQLASKSYSIARTMLSSLVSKMIAESKEGRLQKSAVNKWDYLLFFLMLVKEYLFLVPHIRNPGETTLLKGIQFDPATIMQAEKIGTPIQLEEGQVLFEAGRGARQMYIVREGAVQAVVYQVQSTGDGESERKRTTLAEFGPGEFFGEISMLLDIPSTATVEASRVGTKVLQLDRVSYEKCLEILGDEASKFIHQTMKNRLVQNFRRHPGSLLSPENVPSADIYADIARLCEIQQIPADTDVFKEGDEGTNFYMIAYGTVAIVVGGEEVRRLGPGSYFGELSQAGAHRTATVTAVQSKCVLLTMNRESFEKFLSLCPACKVQLEARQQSYKLLSKFKAAVSSPFSRMAAAITSPTPKEIEKIVPTNVFRTSIGLHLIDPAELEEDMKLIEAVLGLLRKLSLWRPIDTQHLNTANKANLKNEIQKTHKLGVNLMVRKSQQDFDLNFGSTLPWEQKCIKLIQEELVPQFQESMSFLTMVHSRLSFFSKPEDQDKLRGVTEEFLRSPGDAEKIFSRLQKS